MIIKFTEIEATGICSTPCPFGHALAHGPVMVNSHTCVRCHYFGGLDESGDGVVCNSREVGK
jgi:hypothetical protein